MTPRRAVQAWLGRTPPPAVLAISYMTLIVLGAAALKLPFMTYGAISISDALFTSTAAVTVTGLAVINTAEMLTFWGHLVILLLIQLGGLGLMTFAVLVLSALGVPLGITHHTYLREDLKQTSYKRLIQLVKTIFRVVLLAEIAGALLLCLTFVPSTGLGPGLWHAVFHSISAFNNAGFSTFPQGLTAYATDPVVNSVIPLLFITGGIGYVVISDIFHQRFWHGWSLHTRLMLVGSAALIVVGVGLTALLEWNNPHTLGAYDSVAARMTLAWFHGVTPRSSGFVTIDTGALHESTSLLYMALMVIGGGSTSTAGGIKVTTLVVMLLATLAFFRRRTEIWAFGRSIGLEEVLKVMALIAIAVVLVFSATFLMLATQDGDFLAIGFEVVSAFGNVGLSRGYTSELDGLGRTIIMMIMFLGRVGPLTLGFFLAARVTPRVRYPEGQVHLG
ncbi:TrkH family potassium uptake protein [Paracoccus onubensis]|uniref:TrkH family potassium uptake protein n=1 Tax=Paracoccus onubensis TaxID=1675788 RepID=UPI0026A9769E